MNEKQNTLCLENKCIKEKLGIHRKKIHNANTINYGIVDKRNSTSAYTNFAIWILPYKEYSIEDIEKWFKTTLRKINLQLECKTSFFVCEFAEYKSNLSLRKRLYKQKSYVNIEFTIFYNKKIDIDEKSSELISTAEQFYQSLKTQDLFQFYSRRK